jgi:RNA recognition motif-containing protein
MRVSSFISVEVWLLIGFSIVEYATREQAQQAVNTLSNQNLMGRLVYVREVGLPKSLLG